MLIVFYDEMTVVGYPFFAVVVDTDILILFRMDKDLLITFFVFETDFIESIAAFGTVGF